MTDNNCISGGDNLIIWVIVEPPSCVLETNMILYIYIYKAHRPKKEKKKNNKFEEKKEKYLRQGTKTLIK